MSCNWMRNVSASMVLTWSTVLIKPCSSLDWRATVSIAFSWIGVISPNNPSQNISEYPVITFSGVLSWVDTAFKNSSLICGRRQLCGLALAAVVNCSMMDGNGRLAGEGR